MSNASTQRSNDFRKLIIAQQLASRSTTSSKLGPLEDSNIKHVGVRFCEQYCSEMH